MNIPFAGTGAMAYPWEDLSLIPSTHITVWVWWYILVIETLVRQSQEDPPEAHWPDCMAKLVNPRSQRAHVSKTVESIQVELWHTRVTHLRTCVTHIHFKMKAFLFQPRVVAHTFNRSISRG